MKPAAVMMASLAFLTGLAGQARTGTIVNIDATKYGYNGGYTTYSQPPLGTVINPITNPSNIPFDQLVLGPGEYKITNATGLPGANPNFTAWRYDSGPTDWAWIWVMVDNVTHKVIGGADEGTYSSQAAAAASSKVEHFSTTLTLPSTTTVDFMIRDYYLPDNAGGIALNVQPIPEPASLTLLGIGAVGVLACASRRRRQGA